MHRLFHLTVFAAAIAVTSALCVVLSAQVRPWDPSIGILLEGTVVTMNDARSYLKARSLAGAGLTDTQFLFGVLIPTFGLIDGKLNIEAMSPQPLFMADDDWRFATLDARVDPENGLVADETPPYRRYPANFDHVTALGNPFDESDFELRWYTPRGVA
jgi:hypothetical protein